GRGGQVHPPVAVVLPVGAAEALAGDRERALLASRPYGDLLLRGVEAQLLALGGVEHAERSGGAQGRELAQQLFGRFAAAQRARGYLAIGAGAHAHPDLGLVVAPAALDVGRARAVLVVHLLHFVLGGLQQHHLAGGPLGLALPGAICQKQSARRQTTLQGRSARSHAVLPGLAAAAVPWGRSAFPPLLRRRVIKKPRPRTSAGATKTVE